MLLAWGLRHDAPHAPEWDEEAVWEGLIGDELVA